MHSAIGLVSRCILPLVLVVVVFSLQPSFLSALTALVSPLLFALSAAVVLLLNLPGSNPADDCASHCRDRVGSGLVLLDLAARSAAHQGTYYRSQSTILAWRFGSSTAGWRLVTSVRSALWRPRRRPLSLWQRPLTHRPAVVVGSRVISHVGGRRRCSWLPCQRSTIVHMVQ